MDASKALDDRLRRLAFRAASGNPLTLDPAPDVAVTMPAGPDAGLAHRIVACEGFPGLPARPELFAFHGGTPRQHPREPWLLFPVASLVPSRDGNLAHHLPDEPWLIAWTWEAAFMTDAPLLELVLLSSPGIRFRLLVDGRYAGDVFQPCHHQGEQRMRLDFGGRRRARRIQVRGCAGTGLQGLCLTPLDTVWAPPRNDTVTVAVTGDSYAEGMGTTLPCDPDAAFPLQLGHLMGWADIRQVALGGTGYLQDCYGTRSTVRQQMSRWGFVPDVILCASGFNDLSLADVTPAMIAAEARLTWQSMRDAAPHARIFVVAPWIANRTPAFMLPTELALAAAFADWGDDRAHFIPVSADPAPWTTGTGREDAPTGEGNADLYMSADRVHPNDAGHAYHAARIASALRDIEDVF